MNMEIWTVAAQFLFWEHLFPIYIQYWFFAVYRTQRHMLTIKSTTSSLIVQLRITRP